jgi:hypothetical protein
MFIITYYNKLVNISDDPKINSSNFLKSLKYKESAFILVEIIRLLEDVLSSEANILPSFDSNLSENSIDAQSIFFESIMFRFDEYNTEDIFKMITDMIQLSQRLSKVVFVEKDDLLILSILTQRFLRENQNFKSCEFIRI